jgi:hypothetical protein
VTDGVREFELLAIIATTEGDELLRVEPGVPAQQLEKSLSVVVVRSALVASTDSSPPDCHGVEPGGETMLDAGARAPSA